MSAGPPAHEIFDLSSDEEKPAEREHKRQRKEEVKQTLKQQDQIIDISMSSPEGITPPMGSSRDRRLWGEVEGEGPPRWNHVRRRSSLCPSSNALPDSIQAPDDRNRSSSPHEGALAQLQAIPQHLQSTHAHRLAQRQAHENRLRSLRARSRTQEQAQEQVRQPPIWCRSHMNEAPTLRACGPDTEASQSPAVRGDAAIARALQEREEAAALRRARQQARRIQQEEELSRRISELEELEALEENECQQHRAGQPGAPPPEWPVTYRTPAALSHNSRAGGRRPPGWAPASLAEAMMGMFSEGSPLANMQLGSLSHHVVAVRHAMGALQGPGRLPAHLLFSDRDFDENDYEALLALDDNVVSRKGASTEEIESIPTVVFGREKASADADLRCPICLEDIEPGALLRKMDCKHCFHRACLDKWLSHKSVCPICLQQPQAGDKKP